MRIYQCDRCGQCYEARPPTEREFQDNMGQIYQVSITLRQPDGFGDWRIPDLCAACMRGLVEDAVRPLPVSPAFPVDTMCPPAAPRHPVYQEPEEVQE